MDDGMTDAAAELEAWLNEPGADGLHRWLYFEPPLELLLSTVFTRMDDVANHGADVFDHLDPVLAGLVAYMRHDTARYTEQDAMPWTALATVLHASAEYIPEFRPIIDGWTPGAEVRVRVLIHETADEDGNDLGLQVLGGLVDDGQEVTWCEWGHADLFALDPAEEMADMDLHYGSPLLGAYAMPADGDTSSVVSALAAMSSVGVLPFDHPPPEGTSKAANVVDAMFSEDEMDGAEAEEAAGPVPAPDEEEHEHAWLHRDVLGDTPYWIRELAIWRLATELVRRHPTRLWPVQAWDCGGAYDCLALVDVTGRGYGGVSFNRYGGACAISPFHPDHVGGGDVIRWTSGLDGDPARWVRAVESIAELPTPRSIPASTPMSLAVRVIAGFLSTAFQSRPRWAALHGHQVRPEEFTHLTGAHEWYRANGAEEHAAHRMWFLTPLPDGGSPWPEQHHLPPEVAITQTGIAWIRQRRVDLNATYRANGSSLPALVAEVATGIL